MQSLSRWLTGGLALMGGLLVVLPAVPRRSPPIPRLPTTIVAAAEQDAEAPSRFQADIAPIAGQPLSLVRVTGVMRCGSAEMGTDLVATSKGRYSLEGPRDNANPQLARRGNARKVPAPTADFGGEVALGTEDQNALGRMWGDAPGTESGERGL